MIWIILALTLGASITSIIHGVFMLFGSLSISGTAIPGIPSTMLAVLPVISAIFALIGGIIAFNRSKWGALFLFLAMGLCAPSRDTWLYGGLYFFAGLFCFFVREERQDDYDELYGSYDDDYDSEPEEGEESPSPQDDFYYVDDPHEDPFAINPSPLNDDVPAMNPQDRPEPLKIRRRVSKSCPECGANVPRDAAYCPNCGTRLAVADLTPEPDIQTVNEQLFAPESTDFGQEPERPRIPEPPAEYINPIEDDGDYMSRTRTPESYRVQVRPRKHGEDRQPQIYRDKGNADEAASSYASFSKYAHKNKKRKRSTGRRILSMLLLVAAVGGALYFLLGLRKLPPGELPSMITTPEPDVINIPQPSRQTQTTPAPTGEVIAEPGDVAVNENILPNFTPERTPRNGTITGSGVNVRADHTTSSARVTRLNSGAKVEVLGMFNVPSGSHPGIWYNIMTGGKEGWVYGRYLQPLGSGIPAGYSNALLKSFGSTRTQLAETLGQPTRSTSSSAEWSGLTATLRGEDVTRIRLTGSNRELQNGLKVGMSQTALLQIMGYPSSVNRRTMNYNEGSKTGISVQLDSNNAISSITVNEIQ